MGKPLDIYTNLTTKNIDDYDLYTLVFMNYDDPICYEDIPLSEVNRLMEIHKITKLTNDYLLVKGKVVHSWNDL